MSQKIILQPVVAGRVTGTQTISKLKPQLELNEADFLAVADHGRSINVDGELVTSYWFNRSRYIVAGEASGD